MIDILYLPISFIVGLVVTLLIRAFAYRFDITDRPDARKIHTQKVAYLGGIAVYISFIIMAYIYHIIESTTVNVEAFLIGGLFVLLGTIDDIVDLRAIVKLFFQIVLSFFAAVLIGGINSIEIYSFSFYFNEWQGILVQMIWFVVLINAFNLIDGLDGLASGVAVISLLTVLVLEISSSDLGIYILLVILIGILLSFLFYNFNPATIYLGDGGSMFLGYIIALVSITNYKTVTLTSSFLILLVAFLPLLDVSLSFLRRKLNGDKVFKADSLHFHHRLLMHGYTHAKAVLIMYGFMTIYAVSALIISVTDSSKLKVSIILFLVLLTIIIVEKFYLLSNRYAYFTKIINKLRRKHV